MMINKLKELLKKHTDYGRSRYLNYLFRYDMNRYYSYSSMNHQNTQIGLETEIRLLVHSIEKALSLPVIRPGFGREKIEHLLKTYKEYCEQDTRDNSKKIRQLVCGSLFAYAMYQQKNCPEFDLSFIPSDLLEDIQEESGGVSYSSEHDFTTLTFSEFAKSRHSLRYFGSSSIDSETIKKAVSLAQTAPSACNRQSPHVFACLNRKIIELIMSFHGGIKGFGCPQVILAVTGDLGCYTSEYERNTVYVDGGIFIMNLLYSLHYFGLATCPVIWGTEPDNDSKLRKLLNIPESYTIISLVMVGTYPDDAYKFAKSTRKDVNDILSLIV